MEATSSLLAGPQEIILAAGGGVLMVSGILFLVLRQVRGYRNSDDS
jgi:hypothetical protein